ncbi:hypothetical protein DFJ73DRAFT_855834 [Zopfochytrium polystomum]|nr:hypothetical protein DFJ73DRAFT_855834 [Zopfochytrium polystomum]
MGSSNRKKKLKKQADFQKPKLKVGKKAVKANETDLSFRTRSVNVPLQNLADEGKTSSEAELLKTAFSLLTHHSGSVRRDAVVDAKNLCESHPHLIGQYIGSLLNQTVPMLTDRDADVRRQVISFNRFLSENAQPSQLDPFYRIIGMFACSALNHIMEDIRLDGNRFLAVWLSQHPAAFQPLVLQLIPSCTAILSSAQRHRGDLAIMQMKASVRYVAIADRVTALENICNLLQVMKSKENYASAVPEPLIYASYNEDCLLVRFRDRWADAKSFSVESFFGPGRLRQVDTARLKMELDSGPRGNQEKSAGYFSEKDVLNSVFPVCVDLWLDSATTFFSGTAIRDAKVAESLLLTLKTMRLCLTEFSEVSFMSDIEAATASFEKYVMQHFPFGNSAVSITDDCDDLLFEMNTLVCDTVSTAVTSLEGKKVAILSGNQDRIFSFLTDAYSEKGFLSNVESGNIETLRGVLQVTQSLTRELRKPCLALLELLFERHRQMRVKTDYWIWIFRFLREVSPRLKESKTWPSVVAWLQYLPKALWNLNDSNPSLTMEIIEYLRVLFVHPPLSAEEVEKLVVALVPFFYVKHPSKGDIFGPFLRLSVESQSACVDLLFHVPIQWPQKLISCTAKCFLTPITTASIVTRYLDVLAERQRDASLALPLESFLSLILSIGFIGHSAEELEKLSAASTEKLIDDANHIEHCKTALDDHISIFDTADGYGALIERRIEVVEAAARILLSCLQSTELAFELVEDVFVDVLAKNVPKEVFIGVLLFFTSMHQGSKPAGAPLPTALAAPLGELLASFLLNSKQGRLEEMCSPILQSFVHTYPEIRPVVDASLHQWQAGDPQRAPFVERAKLIMSIL